MEAARRREEAALERVRALERTLPMAAMLDELNGLLDENQAFADAMEGHGMPDAASVERFRENLRRAKDLKERIDRLGAVERERLRLVDVTSTPRVPTATRPDTDPDGRRRKRPVRARDREWVSPRLRELLDERDAELAAEAEMELGWAALRAGRSPSPLELEVARRRAARRGTESPGAR